MAGGKWLKGQSGNPKGRPKTSVKELVKSHPQANELVQKLFDVAMDDMDKRQVSAWRILLPKMVPDLKAQTLEVEHRNLTGVIVLPPKVALDPAIISTSEQAERSTFLPAADPDPDPGSGLAQGVEVGTKSGQTDGLPSWSTH